MFEELDMEQINWRQWEEQAFEEAKATGKPVLLAISAVWCHWCHVMDSTTYSDQRVVSLANERFIPIRVDNDRRPDINARYNMGGWPSTAFLTSEGDVLTGATYLPPAQMIELMRRVADVYAASKEELSTRADELRRQVSDQKKMPEGTSALLTEGLVSRIVRAVMASYDPRYGGFGAQQKFPHTQALELLMVEYHRTGDKDLLEVATKTLDAMDSGEIHDKAAGGFFRYSTQPDWTKPHYEKMLEDNAALMAVYVSAYQQTGTERYLDVARDISRYLMDWLYDPETGLFYGSQDAHEDYYQTPPERRGSLEAPRVDRTFYANWNAMAAYGYFRLYQATLDSNYREIAVKCIDSAISHLYDEKRLFAHVYVPGQTPTEYGLLTDQVHMLWTLISAYESTGKQEYLPFSVSLAEGIWSQYHDEGDGLLDITQDRMAREHLAFREKHFDDNALAARSFDRLSFVAHNPVWKTRAENCLNAIASVYESYGMMAAPYALALVDVLDEPVRVSISGTPDKAKTVQLLESAISAKEPLKVVQLLDQEAFQEELGDMGYKFADEPKAYICHGAICQATTDDPDELMEAIASAGGHPLDR